MKLYLIPIFLVIFVSNSQSQIRKYTLFGTGEGSYSWGKSIISSPGVCQLEGGFFILNNLAIGGAFAKYIPDNEYSDSKGNNSSYSVFLRSIYELKPELYFFLQPKYKSESFLNTFSQSQTQTGSLELGISAFLTKNIALEITPISINYSHYVYDYKEGNPVYSLKTEENEFSFRLFSDPQLISLKIYLFTDTLNSSKRTSDLNDRKLVTGSIKYQNNRNGNNTSDFELEVAPSVGVFISKYIMAGVSLGFNHSKFDNEYNKHTRSGFYLSPFFRFNWWLNSNTYLFISPYLLAGMEVVDEMYIGFEDSEDSERNYLTFPYNVGFNLGISTFISPRVVLETYTSLYDYQNYGSYFPNTKTMHSGPKKQSLGLSFINLYLSVGWLIGKGD
jgi:hypothetical protein